SKQVAAFQRRVPGLVRSKGQQMKQLFCKPTAGKLLSLVVGLAPLLVAVPASRADAPAELLKAQAQRVEVIRKARAATCCIFGRGGRGGGSGVVISPDGFALTNFHVTSGAGAAMKVGMDDGKLYDAIIVGIDPVGDVALIKLLGREDFTHAEMA